MRPSTISFPGVDFSTPFFVHKKTAARPYTDYRNFALTRLINNFYIKGEFAPTNIPSLRAVRSKETLYKYTKK